MRISDWSSDVCSSDLLSTLKEAHEAARLYLHPDDIATVGEDTTDGYRNLTIAADPLLPRGSVRLEAGGGEIEDGVRPRIRSEEHTSELQSLMRISYAVFCLKKKKQRKRHTHDNKNTVF